MANSAKKAQTYRHTPAFILLFLAREDFYGSAILTAMQKELPFYRADTAVIYRALQEMEGNGEVKSYWQTDTSGPPRKWYKITDKGLQRLAEFKKDIEMRMKNLEFFLQFYRKLSK